MTVCVYRTVYSAGLVESNGSLPRGGWLKLTCGLTACTLASALGQLLSKEYGRILTFYSPCNRCYYR